MRRVGLTAGVIGALGTAFGLFVLFLDLAPQRQARAEFQSLLKRPTAQGLAKAIAKDKVPNAEIAIDADGIKRIHVDGNSEIESFTMDDGKTVTRQQGPWGLWYPFYPLTLAAGFLAPWATVRLVTWIVSGFIGGTPARQP